MPGRGGRGGTLGRLLRVPATAVRGHPGWTVRNRGGGRGLSGSWAWRKSRASANQGPDCVEVAYTGSEVLVRDSKRKNDGVVGVAPAAWTSFLCCVADLSGVRDRSEPGRPRV
ncbi:DUF397 domain-containing protein [Streptomyces sp. NPDC001273]|uniref:DUF397 domain-containing protein n=1 Tax=unclassified Streptomyces TaxID=2593676 RepID=UPI0033E2A745